MAGAREPSCIVILDAKVTRHMTFPAVQILEMGIGKAIRYLEVAQYKPPSRCLHGPGCC